MAKLINNKGFSLAETLIALGILAVGMLFIAGVFPVAIRLTTIIAERTTAAVVAKEAFAKIRLYGGRGINYAAFTTLQPTRDFNDTTTIFNSPAPDIGRYEFTYPSTDSSNLDILQKQYCWSALCRATGGVGLPVQVTVFVCRKAGRNSRYYQPTANGTASSTEQSDWPRPVKITNMSSGGSNNQLRLPPPPSIEKNFVNDDYTIINDATGEVYRVLRRLPAGSATPSNPDEVIQLDRDWQGNIGDIWVVPPAIISGQPSGRNPCVAVYQEEIQF